MYRLNSIKKKGVAYKRALIGKNYRGISEGWTNFELQSLDTLEYVNVDAKQIYSLIKSGDLLFTVNYKGAIIVSIATLSASMIAQGLEYIGSSSYVGGMELDKDILGLEPSSKDFGESTISSLACGFYNIDEIRNSMVSGNTIVCMDITGLSGSHIASADDLSDNPLMLRTTLPDFLKAYPERFLIKDSVMRIKLEEDKSKYKIHSWAIKDNKIMLELL